MKAWSLEAINEFNFTEIDKPIAKEDEVIVKVRAVGICGSDIPRIYKTGTYHYPLIPGHEFSGEVVSAGGEKGKEWLNKRVGIFPLIPCGKCEPCRKKLFEMCRSYSYIGSRQAGGMAEYVAVPVDNLIELPENVSFEQAAMLEPMAVSVHAIRRVLDEGKDNSSLTVAVCGLGTIGLMITMFLQVMGVKSIFVIGNKDFQYTTIKKMGISENHFCDMRKENVSEWLLEKTDGNGADVFFECVGKNETVAQAVDLTAPAGHVMLVGNPYSDIALEKKVYWKILRNQLTVTGSWNSSFLHENNDDWHYVIECLKNAKISPSDFITHRFSLEELFKGCEIMRDKSEDYIKVMAVLE